jgi:aminoglycoside phosphotransferase (APT) family kinase protein
VFVDDDVNVVGVIDFERVLWADPLMEAQFVGRRAHDEVVEAYGTRLFDQPGAAERRRLYDLYLGLVMTVECAYRHYPTTDIEELGRGLVVAASEELR